MFFKNESKKLPQCCQPDPSLTSVTQTTLPNRNANRITSRPICVHPWNSSHAECQKTPPPSTELIQHSYSLIRAPIQPFFCFRTSGTKKNKNPALEQKEKRTHFRSSGPRFHDNGPCQLDDLKRMNQTQSFSAERVRSMETMGSPPPLPFFLSFSLEQPFSRLV